MGNMKLSRFLTELIVKNQVSEVLEAVPCDIVIEVIISR